MSEFTLPRSGNAPLRFNGELLAESHGHWHAGREQNRWHDVAVYRAEGGRYVVAVQYRTCWQGETDYHLAGAVTGGVAVAGILHDYDPTAQVQGFPIGDAYADRQARLLEDIRRRWEAQVSEVLAECGFAEELDDRPLVPAGTTLHASAELPGGHIATAQAETWEGHRAELAESVRQLEETL